MSVYWTDGTELYHYGIKGQHWGERRYQNEDGTYTEEGKRRYGRVSREGINAAKVRYNAARKGIKDTKVANRKARRDSVTEFKNAKKNLFIERNNYIYDVTDPVFKYSRNSKLGNAAYVGAALIGMQVASKYINLPNGKSDASTILSGISEGVISGGAGIAAGVLASMGAVKVSELAKSAINSAKSKNKTKKK